MSRPAVFFDRDGVLNVEKGYLYNCDDLILIAGAAKAVKKLNQKGIFCCLISNQSGPARNYYPVEHVQALHERLGQLLWEEAEAELDAYYYCPYLSPRQGGINPEYTGWSSWRKPNTGMLVTAAGEHHLNLQQSFVIGDKATDIDLANNVGSKSILVQTGYGKKVLEKQYQHSVTPTYLATDVSEAVAWILSVL